MRKITIFMAVLLLFSFKEQHELEMKPVVTLEKPEFAKEYPEALVKVFNAHGGLDAWKKQKTLVYELLKGKSTEVHTIDLHSRKDKIVGPNFSMGFNGNQVWLLDKAGSYKGDPVFYHNLMFYFFAMPFVLADDGIHYATTEDLEFEGVSYPGIRISYDDGIDTSPKDEYFIHYNPETFEMAWLGYTVTYRSGEKSDNVKWIRYNNWVAVNRVLLPKSMTWYNYEGRKIKGIKSERIFKNIRLSEKALEADFFKSPEGAKMIETKR